MPSAPVHTPLRSELGCIPRMTSSPCKCHCPLRTTVADISRHLIDAFVKGSRDAYKKQALEAWVSNSSPTAATPGG